LCQNIISAGGDSEFPALDDEAVFGLSRMVNEMSMPDTEEIVELANAVTGLNGVVTALPTNDLENLARLAGSSSYLDVTRVDIISEPGGPTLQGLNLDADILIRCSPSTIRKMRELSGDLGDLRIRGSLLEEGLNLTRDILDNGRFNLGLSVLYLATLELEVASSYLSFCSNRGRSVRARALQSGFSEWFNAKLTSAILTSAGALVDTLDIVTGSAGQERDACDTFPRYCSYEEGITASEPDQLLPECSKECAFYLGATRSVGDVVEDYGFISDAWSFLNETFKFAKEGIEVLPVFSSISNAIGKVTSILDSGCADCETAAFLCERCEESRVTLGCVRESALVVDEDITDQPSPSPTFPEGLTSLTLPPGPPDEIATPRPTSLTNTGSGTCDGTTVALSDLGTNNRCAISGPGDPDVLTPDGPCGFYQCEPCLAPEAYTCQECRPLSGDMYCCIQTTTCSVFNCVICRRISGSGS
jgi:hypothetical protein